MKMKGANEWDRPKKWKAKKAPLSFEKHFVLNKRKEK